MSKAVSSHHVLILAAAIVVLGCGGVQAEDASAAPPAFTFSESGTEIVLSVRSTTRFGMGLTNPSYVVFGDGRLAMNDAGAQAETAEGRELYLSRTEVENLLKTAVDHNLMKSDRVSIERELRQRLGSLPTVSDAGGMTVTLRLTSYQEGEERAGPVEKTIGFSAPGWYVRELQRRSLPPIPELDALLELRAQLQRYWDLAGPRKDE